MKNLKTACFLPVFVAVLFLVQGCKSHFFRSNYQTANSLLHETQALQTKPFLKAHMKNGSVHILKDTWQVDTVRQEVSGSGTSYNYLRQQTHEGALKLHLDSVAIFETNVKLVKPETGRIAALSILTGIELAIGVMCIVNPKACFGSCPTFYLNGNDNFHYADAEAFTNAISPSMAYTDVDALNNPPVSGQAFNLTMKNEALETHCIKDVKLLAYPRKNGELVFQSPGNDFYLCETTYPLARATASEGDVTALLHSPDRNERFSLADEKNMHAKEEIFLTFKDVKTTEDAGLFINYRQTLMTTYMFYSAMGYMGDKVGDAFSKLERRPKLREKFDATTKVLGNIAVYAWHEKNKKWELQGELSETGPIALNRQFIPLKNKPNSTGLRLKLVLNKGLWRIDYVALAGMKEKVTPIALPPVAVLNKGKADPAALKAILTPEKQLLSMPGSEYQFHFRLPAAGTDYELFLQAEGYYLEWMRQNWLADKNLLKLRQMVYRPKRYLKTEAKNYKRYESTMEPQFWNSKIDTKTFFYHEI